MTKSSKTKTNILINWHGMCPNFSRTFGHFPQTWSFQDKILQIKLSIACDAIYLIINSKTQQTLQFHQECLRSICQKCRGLRIYFNTNPGLPKYFNVLKGGEEITNWVHVYVYFRRHF